MERVKYHDGYLEVKLKPTDKEPKQEKTEEEKKEKKKLLKRYLVTGQLVLLAFTAGYLAGARDVIGNSHFIR